MRGEFQVHRLDRFIGLDMLSSFMNLVRIDPDFTNSHDPKTVRFDETVTLQFEGRSYRNDGQEERVFLLLKQGCFAIWIVIPDPELIIPDVTIFGDVRQAMSFLGDLRAHHDGLLAFRQRTSTRHGLSTQPD
jgi:hypothetical protein